MYHDAGVGKAMPFPFFSCADDRMRKFPALALEGGYRDNVPAARRREPMDAA
jgi:hypothetical protein